MTKKKRKLEYTITLPDRSKRVFSTKQAIHKAFGISAWKIDKSLRDEEWVYVRQLKGWIKVTVKEVE